MGFWWSYLGWGPWDYLVFTVLAAVLRALLGYDWRIVAILVAAFFLRPFAIRLLRWGWRRGWVKARSVVRSPGVLYCPDCATALTGDSGAFVLDICQNCSGKWCAAVALSDGILRKKREIPEWKPYKDDLVKEDAPCPKCSKPMQGGIFLGTNFTTFRCATCDGYWLSRIDWVSFELSLL